MAHKVLMGFRENSADYYHAGDMYAGKNAKELEAAGFLEQVLDKAAPAVEAEELELEPVAKKKGK